MLEKKLRVRKQKEFDFIYKKGKKIKTRFSIVIFTPNDLDFNRFAFIVSAKVDKKAVVRNKIKRRLREIIRLNYVKFKKAFDFIVVALPQSKQAEFQDLKVDLEECFVKNKIYI